MVSEDGNCIGTNIVKRKWKPVEDKQYFLVTVLGGCRFVINDVIINDSGCHGLKKRHEDNEYSGSFVGMKFSENT